MPRQCVVHSFRHSMRDRLRMANCPSEMIDQLGGWSKQNIGNNYGLGYKMNVVYKYLLKLI